MSIHTLTRALSSFSSLFLKMQNPGHSLGITQVVLYSKLTSRRLMTQDCGWEVKLEAVFPWESHCANWSFKGFKPWKANTQKGIKVWYMHAWKCLMKPIIFVQFIYANKKLGERNQKAQFMQFKEMCVLWTITRLLNSESSPRDLLKPPKVHSSWPETLFQ
jgi:hypothetical protein